jgi:hypothetical protein
MLKTIELLMRRDSLSHEQFMAGLMNDYAPAARSVPGLRGFIAHSIVREMTRPDIPVLNISSPIDAIIEYWADDEAARSQLLGSDAGRAWSARGAALIGRARALTARAHPLITVATPRPAIKTIAFLCRRSGENLQTFLHHWIDGHGGMARVVPYLQGFILNEVLSTETRVGMPAVEMDAADGFAQGWLASPAAQQKMIATPEAKVWFADGAQTFGQIKSFLTSETIIIPPP